MTRNSAWLSLLVAATIHFSSALPIPASAQTAQPVSFIAHKDFVSGVNPSSTTVGDFNNDGVQDLALTNYNCCNPLNCCNPVNNTVSVLLGNGDGTFQAARTFAVGINPTSVAVGTFNRDNNLDLVVANKGSNTVSVLLGNGDGTFQPAVNFPVGIAPVSVVVFDRTDTGTHDLAVANSGSNTVSVLWDQHDGTFLPAETYVVGLAPVFVTKVPNFTIGREDLVVANSGSNTVSRIVVGTGTREDIPVGTVPWSVSVDDFNHDGVPDLAVANSGDNTITVLVATLVPNCICYTYKPAQTLEAGITPRSVAAGDFNSDGKPDLAVANSGSTTVSVLLGNGDGTFQAKRDFAAGGEPWSVGVGDFNSDGKLDLAVANTAANTVSVLLGNGDGTFPAAPFYGVGSNPQSIAMGDFNSDGKRDLAVANAGSNTVSILLGNGDGTFQAAQAFAAGSGPVSVVARDFNGDGNLDLAVADYGSNNDSSNATVDTTVSVLLGNGDGTFQAARTFEAGSGPYALAVGDFNRDGKLDLAVADLGPSTQRAGTVSVLLGNGDGTFQVARTFAVGNTIWSVAVGDFNGDGKLDLAVPDGGANSVSVLLGNGDGTFQATQSFPVGTSPVYVAVGDFNGDRVQDLAVANYFDFTVSVLLGNGNGTFHAAGTFAVSSFPWSLAVDDFNGDGVQDLAAANLGSTTVSVLPGNGDGTFQAALNFGAGLGPVFVAVDDFNGDGKRDMAVANYYFPGTVSVLINNTATAPSTFTLTVSKAGTGSGTVTSGDGRITCGATCSASYTSGTVVTLTATPAFGSIFTGWSGCDAVSGTTCSVTMNGTRSVTASFTLQTFTLSVTKRGILGGTVTSSDGGINCGATCSASYTSGTVVTLRATPAFLSIFTDWSGCDAVSGSTCIVSMSGARSVTANFLP
ncbi:MAG: VCBS repeat-containing protein [Nitrospirae bacterium]|nr:MAG: VCBS repeat-containing protein [Nitrospirota bacterium]